MSLLGLTRYSLSKPSHQFLRNKDIHKNKTCSERHKGTSEKRCIFNAQNTLTDNQGIYRKTKQACDAGWNVTTVNAYLNQMNKEMKIAAKEGAQPDIPEKITVKKICESRNQNT